MRFLEFNSFIFDHICHKSHFLYFKSNLFAFSILEISGKANVYQISKRFLFRKMLVIKFYQFGVKHAECILHDCFTVGHMSVYNKKNTLECWTILLWCISPSHVHFCFLTIAYVISMYNGGMIWYTGTWEIMRHWFFSIMVIANLWENGRSEGHSDLITWSAYSSMIWKIWKETSQETQIFLCLP